MEIICNLNGKSFKLEDESSRSSSASSTGSKPLIRNKININTNSISNNNNNNTKSQILDLIKNDDVNMFVSTNYDEEDDSEKIFCICRRKNSDSEDDDMMIECDICKDWLHFKCVNINQRISIDIETYVCPRCVSDTNNIVYKKRQNNHRHDYSDSNAAKKAVQAGTRVFVENLLKREFPDAIENNIVIKLDGSQVTLDYLEKNGFDKPILVEKKHGLNFNIPHKDEIDLTKIEDIVGSDVLLDVIDVERQQTVPMTINELNSYFRQEKREKVYNLISFEISKTKLSENVTPPNIVNEISWISNGVWPNDEDNLNNGINNINHSNNSSTIKNNVIKPEVQKYCLISAGSSYTDFHIDFGGSSVWYHVVKGDKIFYLIEPNSENLDAYEKWNSLKNHSEVFLADRVKNCYKFYIEAGNTIFLPTGWIHAVYTPQDSLVFGGNFLQCYNIPLQIKVYDMELRLKTPEKYRFPAFETLQWYAAKYYTQIIKEFNATRKIADQRLLNGLKYLQNTLKKWINSKDYYQLHDHEIPRRINCDKLVKIMHKELGKAEMNFKLNGAYQKSDNKLKQNKFETTEMINHLDRKRMFIDGSNDNSTDEEKLSSMKHKDLPSTKKQKEVLNYGDMNLLEIKLDSELDATDENIISETNISIKQELPNMNENSTEPKKEPLILKIPKAIAIQAENQPTTSTGTLKLKLKITNPDSKANKKEKTLDELIRKENDNDSNKPNDEDDEIIKELTKHSYADSEYCKF